MYWLVDFFMFYLIAYPWHALATTDAILSATFCVLKWRGSNLFIDEDGDMCVHQCLSEH